MDLRLSVLVLVAFFSGITARGQQVMPVMVTSPEGLSYPWAWAGGLNSCQFGETDLNEDGIKDLVVFDRIGNRIMTFLKYDDAPGEISYAWDNSFAGHFPPLSDWMIMADYDGDFMEDIFTYSPGYAGIKVFRNASQQGVPKFDLVVNPYLTSFQGGGQVNILVTYADYPAIEDLDGDGDLDILTFWGLGSFVEMHRNMSMEKYGHADSLDYVKTSYCWGFFAESEESNQLVLDTCIGWKDAPPANPLFHRHTGSSFRILDLDADSLPDLLLGDVDYPNLVALHNSGTVDTARMTSFNWEFPAQGPPVSIYSMPAAAYIDIDNDGLRDLISSPFDPSPYLSGNFESVWLYINEGEDNAPSFKLAKKDFLQEWMIDLGAGAYPVFADYNSDGLPDLFVGNFGYHDTSYLDQYYFLHSEHTGQVALFINTGTAQFPRFDFVRRDFAWTSGLETTGIMPAFDDLDGDGDDDMLLGNAEGTLHFYRNIAPAGGLMEMIYESANYQGIDVGNYSTPCLFDLDMDGLPDLVIGEQKGNLNYYHNDGTEEYPAFNLVTDSLGRINVTDSSVSLDGYSVPFLIRYNIFHDVDLLVGSESGKVFYYESIQDDMDGAFTESDRLGIETGVYGLDPDRGFRTAPAMIKLEGDALPDLIIGNFSGGLEYFADGLSPVVSGLAGRDWACTILAYPVPAYGEVHVRWAGQGGELKTLQIADMQGRVVRNVSPGDGFSPVKVSLEGIPAGVYLMTGWFSRTADKRVWAGFGKIVKL